MDRKRPALARGPQFAGAWIMSFNLQNIPGGICDTHPDPRLGPGGRGSPGGRGVPGAGGVPGLVGSQGQAIGASWVQGTVRPFQSPCSPTWASLPREMPAADPLALGQVLASRNLYSLTQKRLLAGLWEWKRRVYVQRQPSAWGRVSGDFELLGKMVLTPLHQSREVGHPGPAAPPPAASPPRARPASGRAVWEDAEPWGHEDLQNVLPSLPSVS